MVSEISRRSERAGKHLQGRVGEEDGGATKRDRRREDEVSSLLFLFLLHPMVFPDLDTILTADFFPPFYSSSHTTGIESFLARSQVAFANIFARLSSTFLNSFASMGTRREGYGPNQVDSKVRREWNVWATGANLCGTISTELVVRFPFVQGRRRRLLILLSLRPLLILIFSLVWYLND